MSLPAPPLVDSLPNHWLQLLLHALRWDEARLSCLAQQTGALTRRRGIKSVAHLLQLLLLYVVSDAALRDVAAYSTQMGAKLTDEALRQRFHKAEAFLQDLLALLFGADLQALPGRRVLLADTTTVSSPASKGTDHRLHTLMPLGGQGTIQTLLTNDKTAESLLLFDLQPGDLLLADAGLCRANEIQLLLAAQVEVLVRFNQQSWPGRPVERVLPQLRRLSPGQTFSFADRLPAGWPVYIHVLALPQEQADAARRRLRKKNKGEPSALSRELAGYVMVLTTLPPALLSATKALDFYRRRWQIELLFKRQKSLLGLEQLRSGRDSALSRVVLWTKVLYSWLVQRMAERWTTADDFGAASVWRLWRWAREQIRAQLWQDCFDPHALPHTLPPVLHERPRSRTLQRRHVDILQEIRA